MTCGPFFGNEKIPRKPVKWETVAHDPDCIMTHRYSGRKKEGEKWQDSAGVWHVIHKARLGEEAAMDGKDLIEELIYG